MSHILPDQDLDLSFLYEIADGSTEFIIESIDMFLEHTPQLLETISTGITNCDWTSVGSAAHKLKPNLGFFWHAAKPGERTGCGINGKSGLAGR